MLEKYQYKVDLKSAKDFFKRMAIEEKESERKEYILENIIKSSQDRIKQENYLRVKQLGNHNATAADGTFVLHEGFNK